MLCLAVVTLGIFAATLYPSAGMPKLKIFSYDKAGHFIMFGVWSFLYGLVYAIRKNKKPGFWKVFLFGAFFGILIEILQDVLPLNRSAELMDAVADMLGAGTAAVLLNVLLNRYFTAGTRPGWQD